MEKRHIIELNLLLDQRPNPILTIDEVKFEESFPDLSSDALEQIFVSTYSRFRTNLGGVFNVLVKNLAEGNLVFTTMVEDELEKLIDDKFTEILEVHIIALFVKEKVSSKETIFDHLKSQVILPFSDQNIKSKDSSSSLGQLMIKKVN